MKSGVFLLQGFKSLAVFYFGDEIMNVPKDFELDVIKVENEKLKKEIDKRDKISIYSHFFTSFITLLIFNFQKFINIYENALELSFPNMIIEFIKIPLGCFLIAGLICGPIKSIFYK